MVDFLRELIIEEEEKEMQDIEKELNKYKELDLVVKGHSTSGTDE